MQGYCGKRLRVDLSRGRISTEVLSPDYCRLYLGGGGFIAHTLLTEVPADADPLGPANKLIFALGPLSGHPLPGAGRNSIGAKSPMTGGFGETEAGGFFGTELKRAGYDAVIIEGVAPKPVYLHIHDGTAELRDADALWGQEIAGCDRLIRAELDDSKLRTAIIGPGAERLVRYAVIANDVCHIAGRTGVGAVMGSKRLKAVVVRGHGRPGAADEPALKALNRWMVNHFKDQTHMWRHGTGASIEQYEKIGNLPVRNFRGGPFPEAKKITAQVMTERHVTGMGSCYACPIRCKKVLNRGLSMPVDSTYGGPEYETLAALGSNCGVDDLQALIKAHEVCGRAGIDTISAGGSIAFAMECFEAGLIGPRDTDGLSLRFGNAEAMLTLVEWIGRRQGLGDLLAEGSKRAAARIGKGAEAFAIQVKGLEIPMHEPRFKPGMGINYIVNAAGPDHCVGVHDDRVGHKLADWEPDAGKETIPTAELSARKAHLAFYEGMKRSLPNYLGLCLFVPWTRDQVAAAMQAVAGREVTYDDLLHAVRRGMTLARLFNLRAGLSAADDVLPPRFLSSPPEGPLKGLAIEPQAMKIARREYYRMCGWDDAGVPTLAHLEELEIGWAARYADSEGLGETRR